MNNKFVKMEKYILLFCFVLLFPLKLLSQNEEEMYVPLEISYFPGDNFAIPLDENSKDIWVRILTYHYAYPYEGDNLYLKNKEEYKIKNSKLLYTRAECDTFVRNRVEKYTKKKKDYYKYGEGAFYIQEPSGDRMYRRSVCIPAKELMDLGHGNYIEVGIPVKYIEPKDFVAKFKRYKLDSLDLAEAPYYSIFPMDINPSFDCSKASTPIEKAICRDSALANLDRQLAQLYRKALREKGEQVKIKQKEWLAYRDKKCEGKNNQEIIQILKELYNERIQELQKQ